MNWNLVDLGLGLALVSKPYDYLLGGGGLTTIDAFTIDILAFTVAPGCSHICNAIWVADTVGTIGGPVATAELGPNVVIVGCAYRSVSKLIQKGLGEYSVVVS